MGNTSSSSGHKTLVSHAEPLTFHSTHSENIQLYGEGRIARRVESFCKGICFSARPVKIGEEVSIRCEEISTNWSGFLRVGFTSNNPAGINPHTLPRYACPDMTNQPGNWAKALPERFGVVDYVITYHVNRQGEVNIALNGENLPGPFFCGVNAASPIWALIDIYGNAKGVEFVDRMATRTTPSRARSPTDRMMSIHSRKNTTGSLTPPISIPINSPSKYHPQVNFLPLFFHTTSGRCVRMNPERTVATRLDAEYANAYVFCERPTHPLEKVVIQVLAMDVSYSGGLTVGVTSCNPSRLISQELPDDSDQLLDRPEYWVVHKDVVTSAEVGDELCFTMSNDGEILFNRNSNPPVVIMHVDKTVDMWMFWDLYGQFSRIKLFGVIGASRSEARSPPVLPRLNKLSPVQLRPASIPDITSPSASTLTVELPSAFDAPPIPPRLQRSSTLGGAASSPSFHSESSGPSSTPAEVDETAQNLANECTVCFDKPCNCVIYTCGHMCMCYECALSVKASTDPLCPICRQDIKDVIRIYKS
ncbi:protein neuralized-like [Watersipora subatra]|uniref:protein neuralized-like n=1 Tax=Watersipora subatra TaxID=2589382 RepID=UPI00355C34A5